MADPSLVCELNPPPMDRCQKLQYLCTPQQMKYDPNCKTSDIKNYCLPGFLKSNDGPILKQPSRCRSTSGYGDTRACCPGYFCPTGKSCMIPCSKSGSYCPSSNTMTVQNKCYPLGMPKLGPTMGCGGAPNASIACPAGNYCKTSMNMTMCPAGNVCRSGVCMPRKCSFWMKCPKGTKNGRNNMGGIVIVSLLFIIFGSIIFYKKLLKLWRLVSCKSDDQEMDVLDLEDDREDSSLYEDDPESIRLGIRPPSNAHAAPLLAGSTRANGGRNSTVQLDTDDGGGKAVKEVDGAPSTFDEPLPFAVNISFQDLTLTLKSAQKIVVDHVSGVIPAGNVTAIMGASGAGKTSFLFTISGKARSYGVISGKIQLNGENKQLFQYSDIVGFVPQDDIMNGSLTVREILMYNARFRLPTRIPEAERQRIVDDAMRLLEIDHIADKIVGGDEARRGISGGQRKRVNIGMELVANPAVLFLDEPTSGLDATTSGIVMDVLRRIAARGTNVIVVLHQPRYEIFENFDNLILFGVGGRTVYMGPTNLSVRYFEHMGFDRPALTNPADFLLDVMQGQIQSREFNIQLDTMCETWAENKDSIKMKVNKRLRQITKNANYRVRRRAGCCSQTWKIFLRAFKVMWRQRLVVVSDIFMVALAGFVVGLASDSSEIIKVPTTAFLLGLTTSLTGTVSSLRLFGAERAVFWRESSVGLNRYAYYFGSTAAAAVWIVLFPLFYLSLFFAFAMPRGHFASYYIVLVDVMFCAQGFGQLLSVIFGPATAQLVSVVFSLILSMASGFNPTLKTMERTIPSTMLADMSYLRWYQEALWIKEIGAWTPVFEVMRRVQETMYGWKMDKFMLDMAMMAALGVVFRILTLVSLFGLNRDKQI